MQPAERARQVRDAKVPEAPSPRRRLLALALAVTAAVAGVVVLALDRLGLAG
jgi:hypothetical protein